MMIKLANISLFESLVDPSFTISQNSVFNEEDNNEGDGGLGEVAEVDNIDDDTPEPTPPKRLPGIGRIRGRGIGSTHYYTFHGDGEHPIRGRGRGTNFSYTFGDEGGDDLDSFDFDDDKGMSEFDGYDDFMFPGFGIYPMMRRINRLIESLSKQTQKKPVDIDEDESLSSKKHRRRMELQELLDRWKQEDDEDDYKEEEEEGDEKNKVFRHEITEGGEPIYIREVW